MGIRNLGVAIALSALSLVAFGQDKDQEYELTLKLKKGDKFIEKTDVKARARSRQKVKGYGW
jgi:hypothetical protein